jgi:hypothetical protein
MATPARKLDDMAQVAREAGRESRGASKQLVIREYPLARTRNIGLLVTASEKGEAQRLKLSSEGDNWCSVWKVYSVARERSKFRWNAVAKMVSHQSGLSQLQKDSSRSRVVWKRSPKRVVNFT